MKRYPVVLSVAGSDPSGGAGIQADLKTFAALGVYGAAAITAVTIQNTTGVKYVHALPYDVVYDQIVAVMDDIHPDVVKVGMVNDSSTLDAIASAFQQSKPPFLIVDPIMLSSSGCPLMQPDAKSVFVEKLLPLTSMLTPNLPEAWLLAEKTAEREGNLSDAAREILSFGVGAVLIKGGHSAGDEKTDILFQPAGEQKFSAKTVESRNTHGTGCTLSSAIAAYMARGLSLEQSVGKAKEYLTRALLAGAGVTVGSGTGPLNHGFLPEPMITNDYD